MKEGSARRSRWTFELAFFLCATVAVTVSLSVLGRHAGWPYQQGNDPVLTAIYAAHFRQLDFYPIWSGSDAYGMGSPIPLYYSRLFFTVSGGIYLITDQLKLALVLSTGLFLMIGIYGMRLALSVITKRRLLITVGSVALAFANYTFTNWLIRGDFGEFAAMMIVPFLLWWCLHLVTTQRVSYSLIPITALLVYAHVAIAVDASLVVIVALVVFLATSDRVGALRAVRRLGVSAIGALLLLAPFLVTYAAFSSTFDPAGKITKNGYEASRQFIQNGWLYFIESEHPWFHVTGPHVQIDYGIWIPVAGGLLVLAGLFFISRRHGDFATVIRLPIGAFLVATLLLLLLLQFPLARLVYEAVAPLQDTQFAWRMLAIITPLGIVLVVFFGDILFRRVRGATLEYGLSLIWLSSFLVMSPVMSRLSLRFSAEPQSIPTHLTFGVDPLLIDGFNGEYLPRVAHQTWLGTVANYQYLYSTHQEAQPISRTLCPVTQQTDYPLAIIPVVVAVSCSRPMVNCNVREPSSTRAEALSIRLSVYCNAPTLLALPVTKSPFTSVSIVERNGQVRSVDTVGVSTDPRVVVRVSPGRPETYIIKLPTIWSVLF